MSRQTLFVHGYKNAHAHNKGFSATLAAEHILIYIPLISFASLRSQ